MRRRVTWYVCAASVRGNARRTMSPAGTAVAGKYAAHKPVIGTVAQCQKAAVA